MPGVVPKSADLHGVAAKVAALVDAQGSQAHAFVSSADLRSGKFATRNLADAIHFLCTLHGRHPGVVDLAATHTAHNASRHWLIAAVEGFAVERAYLTRLAVAAGPLPSTPGQAESEAAVNGQRHALMMLAQSDRQGCAFGAAATLVLDWMAVRDVLDTAATRWGVPVPALRLPSVPETIAVTLSCCDGPAIERAISFGAQQILTQHHGLWDLLEARHIARGDY